MLPIVSVLERMESLTREGEGIPFAKFEAPTLAYAYTIEDFHIA